MNVDGSLIHRLFYPQVPAILSTELHERVSAMPVVSYASVSDRPPLVAVACNPSSFTCKLVLKSKAFSLSLLDDVRLLAVEKLATVRGADVKDKLVESGLPHKKGRKLKVPVIKGSMATLECKLKSTRTTGDHLLLIGEVKAADASEYFSDFWDFRKYKPILYTGWRNGMTRYPEPNRTT